MRVIENWREDEKKYWVKNNSFKNLVGKKTFVLVGALYIIYSHSYYVDEKSKVKRR